MSGLQQYSFEYFKEMILFFQDTMDDYLIVYDFQNDHWFISERALERFALPSNEFSGLISHLGAFVCEEDLGFLTDDIRQVIDGEKDIHDMRHRWIGKDGNLIWVNCRGSVVRDEAGETRYFLGCIMEIGKRQVADNVSGLLGELSLRRLMEGKKMDCSRGFILRVGIDEFRAVNERMGTEYGDYILKTVGERIREAAQIRQWVFRMSADEFIVYDFNGGGEEEAKALFLRIQHQIEDFLEQSNYEAVFTVSGGVYLIDDQQTSEYDNYMKYSQFALSEAKKRGRNQLYIYKEEDYERFLRTRQILRCMRESVAENCKGFCLNFQPIMSAEDESLFAAESLLRYTMPDGERISPVEFIPILEESGLIIPVGKWIFKNALAMCSECQKKYPNFKVSINLSYIQVLKSPVVDEIMGNIRAASLSPSSVIMEMTESGYLESSEVIHNLWDCLKNGGVNVAIDDFGTGYSNFQSIGEIVPQIVKVDRGFTMKALSREYEKQLMKNIIQMVHSLNLKLCIEGIETKEELDEIKKLNPDFIQGYYYGKPVEREEFIQKYIECQNVRRMYQ